MAAQQHQQILIQPTAELYGLSRLRARDLVAEELAPLLEPGHEDELRNKLDELGHNVAFVAGPLLRLLYTETCVSGNLPWRADVLRDILQHALPQEELLYFLWRCLTEKQCPVEMLRVTCEEHPALLHLHLDFKHRYSPHSDSEITGFPLLCVARRFLPSDPVSCERRWSVLLELGADVNARLPNEHTPVHFVALHDMWHLVEMLLNKNTNIDLEFENTTARTVIELKKVGLIKNYPRQQNAPVSVMQRLYEAIDAMDESAFLQLLKENKSIDVNAHNGRATLLQLCAKYGLSKATEELIDKGADLNLMAGLCIEPVLLAIDHSSFACLGHFSCYRRRLDLKFSHDSGTFLNALALRCTRREGVQGHHCQFHDLIEETIRQKVHVSAKDKFGTTALEVLGFGSDENNTLFHILLEQGGFLTIDENLVLNTRPDVFTSFFDKQLSFVEIYKRGTSTIPWANRSESIEANYRFLEPVDCGIPTRAAEMLPFFEICKSREHQPVLLHPLVSLFLVYKWRKIAFIYIANFILYGLFTVSFSAHVYHVTITPPSQNYVNETISNNKTKQKSLETEPYVLATSVFFWFLLLLRELFQVYISPQYYVRNFENLLELLLLFFSLLTFIPTTKDVSFAVASAIALTYVELTLLIGRHPYTGTYVTMFMRVSVKSIELLLMFSSFIFAFTYAFFVFFYEFSPTEPGMFRDLWHTFLRISAMTVGELNFESLKFSSLISEFAFIAFLILVPVILMNLLNALAVSDTQKVIDEASLLYCIANIKHYTKIEAMWLGYVATQSPAGERCYGFVARKSARLLTKIRSLFSVNVLPFPQNPHVNPEPTYFLKIDLYHRHYYPHPYYWYVAPIGNNPYKVIRRPKTLWQLIEFFYFRILLRGNEDNAVDECRRRKYPAPSTDLNECISTLRRNLQIDMELRQDTLQATVMRAVERASVAHTSALAVLEENVKSKLRSQNIVAMETLTKTITSHDTALADIKQQQAVLSAELAELRSTLSQVATDLRFVSEAWQARAVQP